jgi:peptide subunit release factor 1 (eRF1)
VAVAISAFHARQALTRLAAQSPQAAQAARLHLAPQRQRALYAQWLRQSVKHAERILAEARPVCDDRTE